MAYETLVAVYDTPPHAEAAVKALKAAGFDGSDISMFDSGRLKAGRTSLSPGVKEAAPMSMSTRRTSMAKPWKTAAWSSRFASPRARSPMRPQS
jgi:hypothetical protein